MNQQQATSAKDQVLSQIIFKIHKLEQLILTVDEDLEEGLRESSESLEAARDTLEATISTWRVDANHGEKKARRATEYNE